MHWAGPAEFIKPRIDRNSGGSPENCPKIVKLSKIDDFGGPPENPRKILGRTKIQKNVKRSFFGQRVYYFRRKYVPKETRQSKAAAPLLEAAGGRDNIFVTISLKSCLKKHILTFLDDVEPPEDDFSRIFQGSSEIADLVYFVIFCQFSGDPPESIRIIFLRFV